MDNRPTSKHSINHLLAVGPLPPPRSGANVSFQLFCDHLTECTHVQSLTVIDTSPKRIKDDISILTMGNLRQAVRTLNRFWRDAKQADCTIIFGSNQFLLSLTPLLVLAARLQGKPCFVRSFGGSLDQFSEGLHPILRNILLWGFGQSSGLLVETKLLHRYFLPRLNNKAHHATAYRPLLLGEGSEEVTHQSPPGFDTLCYSSHDGVKWLSREGERENDLVRLRLIFISWVRAEKGVRTLLKALQSLHPDEAAQIRCDIYGPIVDVYAAEFETELAKTSSAIYGGELDNAQVLDTMQRYHALIFPTYYQGEGYPGVIVESMAAGLPVITTGFRSIPDMVEDNINGLVVPPKNAFGLAEAIRFALREPEKLRLMGIENKRRQGAYDIRTVLPRMVAVMEGNI